MCAGLGGDDGGGGAGAVFLHEDGADVMVPDLFDQVDQLLGAGLGTGFLLDGFDDLDAEFRCQIGKAVVEGQDLPTGKRREGFGAIVPESGQVGQKSGQIFFKNPLIFRI